MYVVRGSTKNISASFLLSPYAFCVLCLCEFFSGLVIFVDLPKPVARSPNIDVIGMNSELETKCVRVRLNGLMSFWNSKSIKMSNQHNRTQPNEWLATKLRREELHEKHNSIQNMCTSRQEEAYKEHPHICAMPRTEYSMHTIIIIVIRCVHIFLFFLFYTLFGFCSFVDCLKATDLAEWGIITSAHTVHNRHANARCLWFVGFLVARVRRVLLVACTRIFFSRFNSPSALMWNGRRFDRPGLVCWCCICMHMGLPVRTAERERERADRRKYTASMLTSNCTWNCLRWSLAFVFIYGFFVSFCSFSFISTNWIEANHNQILASVSNVLLMLEQ